MLRGLAVNHELEIDFPHPKGPQCTAMAHQLRIEYAGVAYHVMARGNQGRPIYADDLEPVLKLRGVLFSGKRPDGEARRGEHIRQRSATEEQRSQSAFSRKPSGRRVFCLRPALTRTSQPAAGMLRPRRLGHSQNPSPQDPTQF